MTEHYYKIWEDSEGNIMNLFDSGKVKAVWYNGADDDSELQYSNEKQAEEWLQELGYECNGGIHWIINASTLQDMTVRGMAKKCKTQSAFHAWIQDVYSYDNEKGRKVDMAICNNGFTRGELWNHVHNKGGKNARTYRHKQTA